MSKIKRYSVDQYGYIFTDSDGRYVEHEDYKNLEEENERLKSALRKLLSAIEHKFRHEEGIEEEIKAWYRDFGLKKEQGDD